MLVNLLFFFSKNTHASSLFPANARDRLFENTREKQEQKRRRRRRKVKTDPMSKEEPSSPQPNEMEIITAATAAADHSIQMCVRSLLESPISDSEKAPRAHVQGGTIITSTK